MLISDHAVTHESCVQIRFGDVNAARTVHFYHSRNVQVEKKCSFYLTYTRFEHWP